jgi:trehalose 6-phosphate phosphatase
MGTRRSDLPHWSESPALRRRAAAASAIALALDVDGTLAPILGDPSKSRVPDATREALAALVARTDVAVAAVSGRRLSDLRRLVPLPGVALFAEYGLVVAHGDRVHHDGAARAAGPALAEARRRLEEAAREVPGAWVEQKDVNVVLHFRRSEPEAAARLVQSARAALADLAGSDSSVRVEDGRATIEVRPADGPTKGDAVEHLAREQPGALPIFIGDDVGDEPGFAAAARLGGFGIWVASDEVQAGETAAACRLDGPEDVARWLVELRAIREERETG